MIDYGLTQVEEQSCYRQQFPPWTEAEVELDVDSDGDEWDCDAEEDPFEYLDYMSFRS